MSFSNLLLMTLGRLPVPSLYALRVLPLFERRLRPTNCINTGSMSFFNLLLVTLERCPVQPISELRVQPLSDGRVPPLSELRVRSTNCIKRG